MEQNSLRYSVIRRTYSVQASGCEFVGIIQEIHGNAFLDILTGSH